MTIPTHTIKCGPNTVHMPVIGFGTWQATDEELEAALDKALEAGYRHIDTAHVYDNEKAIGKVVKKWIDSGRLKRTDLFIVTKLPPSGNRSGAVEKFFKRSLSNLQLDYVDLYLIHTPFGFKDVEGELHPMTADGEIDFDFSTDLVSVWKDMEDQLNVGRTKSIGISNFNEKQIDRIWSVAKIKPCVLQIECHAYFQQHALVDYCRGKGMVVVAYSPLGSPGLVSFMKRFGKSVELPAILANPTVKAIAQKHRRSEAQILLRYTVQRGIAVIPKSTNSTRLANNIQLFDFELDAADIEQLKSLDQGVRFLDFSIFNGVKKHPEYPFGN